MLGRRCAAAALAALMFAGGTPAALAARPAPVPAPRILIQPAAFHFSHRGGGSLFGSRPRGGLFSRFSSRSRRSGRFGRPRRGLLHRIARALAFAAILHFLFARGGILIVLLILAVILVLASRRRRRRAATYGPRGRW